MQVTIGDVTVTSGFNGDIELTQRGPDESEDIIFIPGAMSAAVAAAIAQPARPDGDVTPQMVEAGVTALMSSAIACDMRLPETEKERREVVAWIYREMLAAAHDRPGGEEGK